MITPLIINVVTILQLYVLLPFTTVHAREVSRFFLVGAFGATTASLLVNGIFTAVIAPEIVSYTINPIVEETLKVAFVYFLLSRSGLGATFGVSDGLLLGAALGGGFGCAEDTLRALALGKTQVEWVFPKYDLANFPEVLFNWLPTGTVNTFLDGVMFYRASHLEWTAFAAFGAAVFFRLKGQGKWAIGALVVPLAWSVLEHGSINLLSYKHTLMDVTYRPDGVFRQLHDILGRGFYFHYVLSLSLIIASVIDWSFIRRGISPNDTVVLPSRSDTPVVFLRTLLTFFRLRRQMAFTTVLGAPSQALRSALDEISDLLITKRHSIEAASGGPAILGTGASGGRWAATVRGLYLAGYAWLFLSSAIVLWYLLFSFYFPPAWRYSFQQSGVFIACAVTGFTASIVTAYGFYMNRWDPLPEVEDRARKYADVVLIHTSLLLAAMSILQHWSIVPFQNAGFFWYTFTQLLESLGILAPLFLGLLSLLVDLSPAGNIKSAIEVLTGVDPVARTRLGRAERILALLGSLPLIGQGLKIGRAALKLALGTLIAGVAMASKGAKWVSKLGASAKTVGRAVDTVDSLSDIAKKRERGKDILDVFSEAQARSSRTARQNEVAEAFGTRQKPGGAPVPEAFEVGNFSHKHAEDLVPESQLPRGLDPEFTIELPDGGKVRLDRVDFENGKIYEIKPDTLSQIEEGEKQIMKYIHYMNEYNPLGGGRSWQGEVVTYNKDTATQVMRRIGWLE